MGELCSPVCEVQAKHCCRGGFRILCPPENIRHSLCSCHPLLKRGRIGSVFLPRRMFRLSHSGGSPRAVDLPLFPFRLRKGIYGNEQSVFRVFRAFCGKMPCALDLCPLYSKRVEWQCFSAKTGVSAVPFGRVAEGVDPYGCCGYHSLHTYPVSRKTADCPRVAVAPALGCAIRTAPPSACGRGFTEMYSLFRSAGRHKVCPYGVAGFVHFVVKCLYALDLCPFFNQFA